MSRMQEESYEKRYKNQKIRVDCKMKKEHILIPEPNSKFLKVNCKECEKENIVYSHATTSVTCKSCGNVISESTGSKARIIGKISGTAE